MPNLHALGCFPWPGPHPANRIETGDLCKQVLHATFFFRKNGSYKFGPIRELLGMNEIQNRIMSKFWESFSWIMQGLIGEHSSMYLMVCKPSSSIHTLRKGRNFALPTRTRPLAAVMAVRQEQKLGQQQCKEDGHEITDKVF